MQLRLVFCVATILNLSTACAVAQQPSFAKAFAGCDWQPPIASRSTSEQRIFTSKDQGVTRPKLKCSANPDYSDMARKKKISGTCTVGMVLDAAGVPTSVAVVHSIGEELSPKLQKAAAELDSNAVKAVEQYRFEPAMYQGAPVRFAMDVEVTFRIY